MLKICLSQQQFHPSSEPGGVQKSASHPWSLLVTMCQQTQFIYTVTIVGSLVSSYLAVWHHYLHIDVKSSYLTKRNRWFYITYVQNNNYIVILSHNKRNSLFINKCKIKNAVRKTTIIAQRRREREKRTCKMSLPCVQHIRQASGLVCVRGAWVCLPWSVRGVSVVMWLHWATIIMLRETERNINTLKHFIDTVDWEISSSPILAIKENFNTRCSLVS